MKQTHRYTEEIMFQLGLAYVQYHSGLGTSLSRTGFLRNMTITTEQAITFSLQTSPSSPQKLYYCLVK